MTKSDIQSTLANVSNKVLRDNGVTSKTIKRRAKALLLLGQVFLEHKVSFGEGMDDFLNRIGKQTGLFGEELRREESAEEKDDDSLDNPKTLMEMLDAIDSMSVKELKGLIKEFGINPDEYIEKSELRSKLHELISAKLQSILTEETK